MTAFNISSVEELHRMMQISVPVYPGMWKKAILMHLKELAAICGDLDRNLA